MPQVSYKLYLDLTSLERTIQQILLSQEESCSQSNTEQATVLFGQLYFMG